jgi:hypothetical protein
MTKPTDINVLKEFYRKVRPWGFWKPVHDLVAAEHPDFKKNNDFWRDMMNILLGIVGQTAIVALPIYLVIKDFIPMFIALVIVLIIGVIMKKTWWDRLEN